MSAHNHRGDYWHAPFQRAKIIRTNSMPRLLGRELWVRVGPPERVPAYDIERRGPIDDSPTYLTHLYDDHGNPLRMRADQLELLARDKEDFAECVEVEYWKTFRDRGDGGPP